MGVVVEKDLIGGEKFWVLDPTRRESWIWRAICRLWPLARPMVCCEEEVSGTITGPPSVLLLS